MSTTMRRTTSILGLLILAAATGPARAALDCEATVDRTSVPAGEAVVLTVTVTGTFDRNPDIAAPAIDGVEVTPGGSSQRYSFSPSGTEATYSVTYYLQVGRLDDFTIPALRIASRGETCTTRPVAITVTDPAAAVPPTSSGNRSGRQGARSAPEAAGESAGSDVGGRPGDEIYITLETDTEEAWVGEQIVLSFKYFRRINPWDNPSFDPPRTEGFWRVDLPPERHYRQRVAGHDYQVTEIRYALFPTRSGELEISGARLTFPEDPFDRFFSRRRRQQRSLRTPPVTVTVRELPQPRPARFSGLVASELELTATVDRDTVPRGEPVGLQVMLRSDAFLKGFGGVTVPEVDGVQAHDSQENLREDLAGAPRYRATLTQEKALVPVAEGRLDLPELTVSYFNPDRERYETATAQIPPIVVTDSDLPVAGDQPSGFRRTEIARLGNDLAFIHTVEGPLARAASPWPERPLWWVLLLLPPLMLAIQRVYLGRLAADRRDPVGTRRRRALARALRALRQVRRTSDPAARLALVQRAVRGYVADRTGRAEAGLTAADVRRHAETIGEVEAGERLAGVLDLADDLRFSGASPDAADPGTLLAAVPDLLQRLERAAERRRRPGRGRSVGTAFLALWLGLGALAGGAARAQDVAPAAGPRPGVDPARLVAEGNRAYTEGDIATAVDRYEEARSLGGDAAALHYNLGNAYARQGQLGRAIASYLRAQRRDPRDPDIDANLAWVRSHTRDLELGGGDLPPVVAQLDRWSRRLTLGEWALVSVALVWLGSGLLAWSWWRGWLGDGTRRVLLGVAVLLLVSLLQTGRSWWDQQVRDLAVITAEEVEVRSGPATTFPAVFRVHDGLTLVVRGRREGWVRIGLGGEWVGWVPEGALERVRREA